MGKKKIFQDDFLRMLRCSASVLPGQFFREFRNTDTAFKYAGREELDEYILYVLKKMERPDIRRTKEENLQIFEKGWMDNLRLVRARGLTRENLRPKYFRRNKFLRFKGRIIVSENLDLEYKLFVLARHVIFAKYLSPFKTVYEFGCGSCQNLYMLSNLYPDKELCGLDFTRASSGIADYIGKSLKRNIRGILFDMQKPKKETKLKSGSAVFTIHALEQLGRDYEGLISFIIKSQPAIVVHYEPIMELYDQGNLLDYLAVFYSKQRNYLDGFLTYLRKLKNKGKIEILEAYRPYLGGVIHESSLVIWRPKA